MANKDHQLQVFLNILFFNHFEVYSSVVLSEFTLLCCVTTSKYASCLLHVSGRKQSVSGLGLVPSAPWNVPIPWAPCNVMLQEVSWLVCWVLVGLCLPVRKERMRSAWRLRWLSLLELAGNQGAARNSGNVLSSFACTSLSHFRSACIQSIQDQKLLRYS